MTAARRTAVIAAAALAGCIQIPSGPAVMCEHTADCGGGEVCEQGVCWGDPPTGSTFAATLTAPAATSTSLVGASIAELALPTAGYLGDLELQAPVMFSGRVEATCDACSTSSVAAQITLTSAAAFAGGPTTTLSTTSIAGAVGDSFSLTAPPLSPAAPPYELTITPIDDPTESPSPATVAPPLRQLLPLTGNDDAPFALGGAGLVHVTGTLSDTHGFQLPIPYDVAAYGRWNPAEAPQIVSNIVHTLDGSGDFDLVLSAGVVGTVDIVATPSVDATSIGPTLTLTGISLAGSASIANAVVEPATLGKLVPIDIVVVGTSGDGTIQGIPGVAVDVTAQLGGGSGQPTIASLEVQTTTGSDGRAQVTLLDGLGEYAVDLVPPATSPSSALFAQPLDPVNDTVVSYQLPQRIALNGTIVDASGRPVNGVQVTAAPSASFLWSLADAPQAFLESITLSPVTTTGSGDFVVFVDPAIDGVPASYDLQLEPASETVQPHFSRTGIAVDPTMTTVQLGVVKLPQPAFLHGEITDPNGNPVAGANLAVYLVISDTSACQAANAPDPCAVPAVQEAHAESDGSGVVEFSLPR